MISWNKTTVLFVIVLLISCANPRMPQGGPVDTEAPTIIDSYPENGSTNFSENFISFAFSEYVDKSSFRDAFFISPSIEGEIEYDWSGTDVDVIFHDGLKKNTTYSVSIGTDVKDINNGNKMLNTKILTFSTGEKIDKGIVAGKMFGDNFSGAMVFAYKNFPDTLNPSNTKPDYVSQVSEDGDFKLLGLSEGNYRIFAVKDEFKDLLYQTEEDLYGCYSSDINLGINDSSNTKLRFMLTRKDTSKPKVSEATMIDQNHLIVEFTENIDSSKINLNFLSIIDTVNNRIIKPVSFYMGKKRDNYTFIVTDTLINENEYSLEVDNFVDLAGNKIINDNVTFIATSKLDTSKVKLKKTKTLYQNGEIDNQDPFVILEFNDALKITDKPNFIEVSKNKKPYNNFRFEMLDGSKVKIYFTEKLRLKEEIEVFINNSTILDYAGNKCDSIKAVNLKVIDGLNFSGVSGKIKSKVQNLVVVIKHTENGKFYKQKVSEGKFNFEKILPGKYLLWYFSDSNSDGDYNFGNVFPFEKSEKFNYFRDTLELKARWPVGDIEIDF